LPYAERVAEEDRERKNRAPNRLQFQPSTQNSPPSEYLRSGEKATSACKKKQLGIRGDWFYRRPAEFLSALGQITNLRGRLFGQGGKTPHENEGVQLGKVFLHYFHPGSVVRTRRKRVGKKNQTPSGGKSQDSPLPWGGLRSSLSGSTAKRRDRERCLSARGGRRVSPVSIHKVLCFAHLPKTSEKKRRKRSWGKSLAF